MENKIPDGSSGSFDKDHYSGNMQGSLHPADHLSGQNNTNGYSNGPQYGSDPSSYNPQSGAGGRQNSNRPNNGQSAPSRDHTPFMNRYIPFIMALTALLIAATAFLTVVRDLHPIGGSSSATSSDDHSAKHTKSNHNNNIAVTEMGKTFYTGVIMTVEYATGYMGPYDFPEDTDYSEDVDPADTDYSEDVEVSGDGEKITLIMSQRDEFLSSLEADAIQAAEELGVELVTQDANQDEFKQIHFVQAAAADGQKAVIVNPINPSACQSIIEAAGDMKVVFVNRIPDDTSILNESAVYVGSDEHTSGKFQGDFLAMYFKAKGQTDIKYILLRGIEGLTSTTLRSESVLQALADNGINATELYAKSCLYDRTEALMEMTNILADTSNEFDCIICNNDAMALGAIEACIQAGKGIDFPIVGIDATADGRQAVKDGTLAMTVFQDPNGQGRGAVAAALNLINGAALNENTAYEVDETGFILWVPFEVVTPDNVAEYDNR